MLSGLKILITGAHGQLGSEFCKVLKSGGCELGSLSSKLQGCEVYGFGSTELNICNFSEVLKVVEQIKPFCVINCAAFTKVDLCETEQIDAFKVNALGARNLAMACEVVGAKLVHISTDYVFDGNSQEPYDESSLINPQNIYGKSKALGEFYVRSFCNKWFIVRTSWLYGLVGKNFVKTILKLAKSQGELKVVNDQFGSPTNACDLVFSVCSLIGTNEFGIYHGSGEGSCSWHEFAKAIVNCFKLEAVVKPCSTDDFKLPAKRPKFSVMRNLMFELTVGNHFRPWKQALESYCSQINLNSI